MATLEPYLFTKLNAGKFKTTYSTLDIQNTAMVTNKLSSDTMNNQDIKNYNQNMENCKIMEQDNLDVLSNDVVHLPPNYFADTMGSKLNYYIKEYNTMRISHSPAIPIYGN